MTLCRDCQCYLGGMTQELGMSMVGHRGRNVSSMARGARVDNDKSAASLRGLTVLDF